MTTNPLKERLQAGHPTVGTWCEIPDPFVAEILASAGYDMICVDWQHGAAGPEGRFFGLGASLARTFDRRTNEAPRSRSGGKRQNRSLLRPPRHYTAVRGILRRPCDRRRLGGLIPLISLTSH